MFCEGDTDCLRWALISAVIVVDQLTKWLVRYVVSAPITVTSWWCIRPACNSGGTWGLGSSYTYMPQLLVLLTVVMVIVLHRMARASGTWANVGYGLIIGGAFSNLIDRVLYCAVFDFILLHYQHYCWPIFNLADVAIVTGVAWLCVR